MNILTKDIIRVVWKDSIENYSKERENQIKADARKKFGTNRVSVVFDAINNATTSDVDGIRIDASSDIANTNYQLELAKKYCDDNKLLSDVNWEHIVKLDKSINADLEDYLDLTNRYKTVYVRYIEFYNFLSYGPKNNTIRYDELEGITIVQSNPQNFGGKSTAILDALLFLFFNKTTKTTVAADIFNENTDHNEVRVRGELLIDGKEYILERELKRRIKRDGDVDVRQTLTYYEKLPMGGLRDLKGDERKYTEKELAQYIGTYDDFLLTTLTKADTLEDLINAKPTERGRTFTRFVGLELFREKEELAKSKHKEWLSSSLLGKYNTVDLKGEIELANKTINELQLMITQKEKSILGNQEILKGYELERDKLITARHDIDTKLSEKSIDEINLGITRLKNTIAETQRKYDAFIEHLKEPDEVYDLDVYKQLEVEEVETTNALNKLSGRIAYLESKLAEINNSGKCEFCSLDLSETDYYVNNKKKYEAELNDVKNEAKSTKIELDEIKSEKFKMVGIKDKWDAYQKDELQRDKYQFELSKFKDNLAKGETLLKQIKENQAKLEQNREIDSQTTKLNAKIEITRNQISTDQMTLGSYRAQITEKESLIENRKSIMDKVSKDEYVDKLYNVYKTIYGKNGISKMVLGTLLPAINSNLNELMVDSADFVLEMDLNSKNELEYYIIKDATSDKRRKLSKGSGYEKTISALALRTVLTKFCSLPKPQFIIFDEVFGAVATENLELIGLFFEKIKRYFDNIIIISHNTSFQSWGDSTITIKKVNEISEIV